MPTSNDSNSSTPSSVPPEAWEPLFWFSLRARRPLERFLHIQAASGIVLILAAAMALTWANSPWAESYTQFWQSPIGIRIGGFSFERTLEWVVNDGLMVIFFFVVGLEIRREIHQGELSEWRRAALPVAAALGDMLAPAALYLFLVDAPSARSGWGVPMATDIAFAVGILTLLGKRVPAALRVLLLAIAVIDDLGAIIVIAVFYSAEMAISGLLTAIAGIVGVFFMQRLGVRNKLAYVIPSVVAWGGIYAAGVHPTIAGVVVGLMTPVRAWLGTDGFTAIVRRKLDELVESTTGSSPRQEVTDTLREVAVANREAISPAESLITALHPWVAFGIMPIFALANAGVVIPSGKLDPTSMAVAIAVSIGLVVGKPVGVLGASWLAVKSKIGVLPVGISFRQLAVLGVVAGIGFTMALFIAQLAFTEAVFLAAAKLGIMIASGCAAVLGLALGRFLLFPTTTMGAALTADDAERSTEM